jgi:Protein of unknown function (DUF2491)
MSFAFIKSILAHKMGFTGPEKKGERLATGTQLDGLHLRAIVKFDRLLATFLLLGEKGSFVTKPAGELNCVAYGRIEDGDFIINRFYLEDGNDPEKNHILQVITRSGKLVDDEVKLFQLLAEEHPDDWMPWLEGTDDKPPIIGGVELNWTNEDTKTSAQYFRVWQEKVVGAVKLNTNHELIYVDATSAPHVLTHQPMLYARDLGGNVYEYVLIGVVMEGNFSELEDGTFKDDNENAPQSVWVEGHVGINISPNELIVIGA